MPDDSKSIATANLPDVAVPAAAVARGVEPHVWNALKQTLWKSASDSMILVALDYCRARRLDPIKRPIHIVKTWDMQANNGNGGYVDAIWEGIGSHRTTASRSGVYAGKDAPEFGPTVTRRLGPDEFQFPEWCRVTVHKIVGDKERAFVGEVRWLETFASMKGGAPNSMWKKRPWGQLAKCAEAEALRAAFPDELGDVPTAEELDGQHVGPERARDITPPAAPAKPQGRLAQLAATLDVDPSHDADTGEILPPVPGDDGRDDLGLLPIEQAADGDLLALASRLETDMLAHETQAELKAWFADSADVTRLRDGSDEFYADLVGKVKARLKTLKK